MVQRQIKDRERRLEQDNKNLSEDMARVTKLEEALNQSMANCQAQANAIGRKRAEIEEARSTAAQKTLDANNEITDQITKRKELKETKKGLYEGISKEMKGVDLKKLKAIKGMYNRDAHLTYALDTLCKFIEGHVATTYSQTKDAHTKNVEEFQQAIRGIKYNALPFNVVQDIMMNVAGTDGNPSQMIQDITGDKKAKAYLDFYPFFKTLSKICHWSMVSMRDDLAAKKIEEQEKLLKDMELERKRNDEILAEIQKIQGSSQLLKYLATERALVMTKKDKIQRLQAATREKLQNLHSDYYDI
jgi:hypothetical protein